MMWHSVIRPLLFSLSPEVAHTVSLKGLSLANKLKLLPAPAKPSASSKTIWGLTFPNIIGLAAGLDKNADYIEPLSKLGFGFIEVGTVTPRPQAGNPTPRLFRLSQSDAIINRMGFNNKGVAHVVAQLQKIQNKNLIIGVNIGKNRNTPLEQAFNDYVYCLEELYGLASYLVVNISSPNTPGLRDLHNEVFLKELLGALIQQAQIEQQRHGKHTPLLIKVAPDLTEEQIKTIAEQLITYKIDGVIATNTTITRPDNLIDEDRYEVGGLSGKPVRELSNNVIRTLRKELGNTMPIIGVGGIFNAADVAEKIATGADLVQVYTGFIYEGPGMVRQLLS